MDRKFPHGIGATAAVGAIPVRRSHACDAPPSPSTRASLSRRDGSGLGFAGANPWSAVPQAVATFTIGAGIWLIVMQWLSSALGGCLAGRLRKKWVGVRTDEVFFRDTAHGLLAWALATAIVALLFTLGSAAVASSAAVATDAQVSAEAAEQARKAAASFSILSSLPNYRRVYRQRRGSPRRLPPR